MGVSAKRSMTWQRRIMSEFYELKRLEKRLDALCEKYGIEIPPKKTELEDRLKRACRIEVEDDGDK